MVPRITLVVFIASSLLDMCLRLDPPDAAQGLRNVRYNRRLIGGRAMLTEVYIPSITVLIIASLKVAEGLAFAGAIGGRICLLHPWLRVSPELCTIELQCGSDNGAGPAYHGLCAAAARHH